VQTISEQAAQEMLQLLDFLLLIAAQDLVLMDLLFSLNE